MGLFDFAKDLGKKILVVVMIQLKKLWNISLVIIPVS